MAAKVAVVQGGGKTEKKSGSSPDGTGGPLPVVKRNGTWFARVSETEKPFTVAITHWPLETKYTGDTIKSYGENSLAADATVGGLLR